MTGIFYTQGSQIRIFDSSSIVQDSVWVPWVEFPCLTYKIILIFNTEKENILFFYLHGQTSAWYLNKKLKAVNIKEAFLCTAEKQNRSLLIVKIDSVVW